MGKFADNQWFEIEHCCKCGIAFAMPVDYQKRLRNDHSTFYCPAGHGQHYTGKSEEQKLRDQLAQRDATLQREQNRANQLRHERDQIAKAHRKMRIRVMNGVCPCCNRSFENLRQHMATQHSDFGQERTLKALREAFGMTQADVAEEAGTKMPYVSLFERGKPVPVEARESLTWWLERQGAK
jgi:DNA-binding XRE family transcriptional regulator